VHLGLLKVALVLYFEALDFPSINAGVNIKCVFINPDINVGGEKRIKVGALAHKFILLVSTSLAN
jgi:hypothetical protein